MIFGFGILPHGSLFQLPVATVDTNNLLRKLRLISGIVLFSLQVIESSWSNSNLLANFGHAQAYGYEAFPEPSFIFSGAPRKRICYSRTTRVGTRFTPG